MIKVVIINHDSQSAPMSDTIMCWMVAPEEYLLNGILKAW